MNSPRINRVVLVYILLFPALVNVFGDAKAGQRLLHVVTVPLLAFLILLKRDATRARLPAGVVPFTCAAVAYYLAVGLFATQGIDIAGVVDIGRPIIYVIYLLFPFFFPLDEAQFEAFVRFLVCCAVLQIAFSALVYVPALSPLQDIFKGRLSNDAVLFHHFRWSGTLAWPSDFSFFLSIFIYFAYLQVLSARSFASRARWAGLGAVLLVGVLFTTSRGGLATIAVMAAIATVLFGRWWHMVAIGGAMVAVLIGLLYAATMDVGTGDELQISYVTRLLDSSDEVDASTGHRIHELQYATSVATEHFPFGVGPDRGEIDANVRVVESLYGHHLIKWGFTGLALYLCATGYTFLRLWRGAKAARSSTLRNFCFATLLWAISVPLLFGWSSAVTDRFKCLPLYYFIVGHVWSTFAMPTKRAERAWTPREHASSVSKHFPLPLGSSPGMPCADNQVG